MVGMLPDGLEVRSSGPALDAPLTHLFRAMALNFGQLAFYSEAKSRLSANKAVPAAAVPWTASVVAGFFASFFSLPFDFVKTRLQNQRRAPDGTLPYASIPPPSAFVVQECDYRYKGTIDCALKVAKEEGLLRFYRGFGTYFVRYRRPLVLPVADVSSVDAHSAARHVDCLVRRLSRSLDSVRCLNADDDGVPCVRRAYCARCSIICVVVLCFTGVPAKLYIGCVKHY